MIGLAASQILDTNVFLGYYAVGSLVTAIYETP